MSETLISTANPDGAEDEQGSLLDLLLPLAQAWKVLLLLPLLVGGVTFGVSTLIAPTYSARTSLLPPPQAQGGAAGALASLGALSAVAGVSTRTLSDQYAALLVSETVQDRIIDKFELAKAYGKELRVDVRRILEERIRVNASKKDGLITIEADDRSPTRAAEIANQHVEELRRLTSQLALTEAQQRRAFFEAQLKQTRDALSRAQAALESSGFNASALRTEPRAAVEGYARLRADLTAAEVRVQALRRSLTDSAPEVQQQLSTIGTLRQQLAAFEASSARSGGDADYISKLREFKYQETLFELYARQFELARLEESREGALIQVIDVARPPERKSKPRRATLSVGATLIAGFLLVTLLLLRSRWRRLARHPLHANKIIELKSALRGR